MEHRKLKEFIDIKTGKLDANVSSENGKYPFFTCSKDTLKIDTYSYDCECVLLAGNGDLNVKYYNGKFDAYQRTYILECKNNTISTKYLYYFMKKYIEVLRNQAIGGVIKYIKLSNINDAIIPIYNSEYQEKIVKEIEQIGNIIDIRNKQLEELENITKSQFVEMFGDPIINDKNINSMKMPDVCEIIDGDRGKNYPKAEEFFEEEYCLFLNAKNVTTNGFSFENCMFITEEKDKKLRNGKLKRGDVVLTTRGTIGNLAFYNEEIPFENVRINSGMVILRMKKDIVNEIFFIEQFKMQLDDIKNKIANGSAQPQLPIIKMNGIKVLSPDIELQNQFADIVKQIDKQKFEIEKSLKEMQELYESLMEKYFG